MPLAWTLAPAVKTGAAVRHLRGELVVLGSGWTGTIHAVAPSEKGASVLAWEWSRGADVHHQAGPSCQRLGAGAENSVGCPGGKAQVVTLRSPSATGDRNVALRAGFHWYSIGLGWAQGAGELALSYRCVVSPPAPRYGHAPPQEMAVAIAGLELSG